MRIMATIAAAAAMLTGAAAGAGAAIPNAAPSAAQPSAQAAATRHFEGTVASVNRDARTFRLRDSERGTVRVKVTSKTRFQRISGFSGLRRGLTNVEATVRRSNGAWVATTVERSGGGGNHGGGNDDPAGDDNGSGGHGSDD